MNLVFCVKNHNVTQNESEWDPDKSGTTKYTALTDFC
jgi:hypothetical protein